MKIQKELNETKETLQKAIQSTLERGECANGRIGTNGARRNLESEANGESYFRRETRQPCRKVRQLKRFEQDVLHSSEEAELVLRGHVNYGAAGAYELNGFARSICAASGWVEQRVVFTTGNIENFSTWSLITGRDAFIPLVGCATFENLTCTNAWRRLFHLLMRDITSLDLHPFTRCPEATRRPSSCQP
jgi:hypothetical protein